jgi:uncharacterized protein with ATP-grasp and redox domains
LKPEPECASCLMTWLIQRIATMGSDSECYEVIRSVSRLIHDEFYPAVNLGSLANRSIQIADPLIHNAAAYFEKIKRGNNQLARRILVRARNFVDGGETAKQTFERACAMAAAGNVAPINAPSQPFRFEEVEKMLEGRGPMPVIVGDIHEAAARASNVLYVTDNSGEIGFDSLVLEQFKEMGSKITLVVKDGAFFEDATQEDVSFFGLDKLVDRVLFTRGFFVPHESPPPLLDAIEKSDLVICKGTGNFEGLERETGGRETIFMLKLKCGVIARKMGMEIGGFVVKLVQ